MNNTKIEWTEVTWNPVRGCEKISPGCKNCYAERFAERFRGVVGHPYEQGFDVRTLPDKLIEPFHWTQPKTVFVNSMSDLFQNQVPTDFIVKAVKVMSATPWHTYQVLTKRAERLSVLLKTELRFASDAENIWWGVSVEDRKHGLPRIQHLREAPAAIRFLSVEPLLEDLGEMDLTGIGWCIVGGESGPGARPMEPEWVESVYRQCRKSDVPFFFKQWGGVNKKKAGREFHDRTFNEMPDRKPQAVPAASERNRLMQACRNEFEESTHAEKEKPDIRRKFGSSLAFRLFAGTAPG